MRLVYLGSPAAAVAPLVGLVGAGHHVDLVVSQPDRRRGRGSTTSPSAVKDCAESLGLAVSDDPDDVLRAAARGVELGVVVAYGRLIKQPLLDALPFVNLHFSLLPRWRGAAPVERAILADDAETGVCVMRLEAGLDTGPVHARVATPIAPDETAEALRGRLVKLGTDLLVESLANGLDGLPTPQAQVGDVTYAHKLDPAEFELDWSRPATELVRSVRVGRAWTTVGGRRLRILAADVREVSDPGAGLLDGVVVGAGTGSLELRTVQPEGRSAMAATDWRNGVHVTGALRFGT